MKGMAKGDDYKQELLFSAQLLKELQDEEIPLSYIMRRMRRLPFLQEDERLQHRIRRELEGFPRSEEGEVRAIGRVVKQAGEWCPFFGPIEVLERWVELATGDEPLPPVEPGGVVLREEGAELLDDREEVESALRYLRKLRRYLLEAVTGRYFELTERFRKHFEGIL